VCEPPTPGLPQYCAGRVNDAKLLPPDPAKRRRMILADNLDVLFYGTNLTTASHDLVLLAQHRLARVQVTGVANVVTTGLGNVDYFLSGTTSDPAPDSADHYTEKLFRMEGSAHCFSYGFDVTGKPKPVTRAELGLRDDQIVFVSGANLYKLGPELIAAWAKILAEVPNPTLMLFPFGPHWYPSYPSAAFERQARSVMGERVLIMQPQPAPDRHQLREYFRVADVYLDSFPFCGSTSLIEPLEVGLPIVTRGGSTFRSAMGGAILREIGMEELIAGSEERYGALAIELARDGARRKAIGERIRLRMNGSPRPSFLDSAGYARRVAAAFEGMLASRG
jgi:predicted O-linked N-acetylglucosamine transferase (SPINDLY family)